MSPVKEWELAGQRSVPQPALFTRALGEVCCQVFLPRHRTFAGKIVDTLLFCLSVAQQGVAVAQVKGYLNYPGPPLTVLWNGLTKLDWHTCIF